MDVMRVMASTVACDPPPYARPSHDGDDDDYGDDGDDGDDGD